MTLALAEIFAGDIDFYHDLRRGDRFTVVYESRFVDGEPVGTGRILAAEFVNRGVTLRAFQWRAADGTRATTREDGRSARKRVPALADGILAHHVGLHARRASTRSCRRGGRITASTSRAPTGTPVRATADGVVAFAGGRTATAT